MSNLNLETIELTSTLREAPLNGAPSSQDYNDSQSENLVDLASIVSFINDQLLIILNALPAAAGGGLTGKTLYSDITDQTGLFFNSNTQAPLTIADSLRYILAAVNNLATQMTNLGVDVTTLQTRITASSQNDIVQQLNNLSTTISQVQSALNATTVAVGADTTMLAKFQTLRIDTESIPGTSQVTIEVTWPTPYPSNAYTPSVTILDASGMLLTNGIVYSSTPGEGLVINVYNTDTVDRAGTLCITAKAD